MTDPPATLPDVNPFVTSPRHFVGGMAIGLLLVGVMVGIRELVNDDPPLPSTWLTEADQEALIAGMDHLAQDNRWVAGCMWKGRSRNDIDKVVDLPKGTPRYWHSTLEDDHDVSFVSVDGAGVALDFDEAQGPGYFCYVPAR